MVGVFCDNPMPLSTDIRLTGISAGESEQGGKKARAGLSRDALKYELFPRCSLKDGTSANKLSHQDRD
jgi:hypothetical protein